MLIGYARISSNKQKLDMQIDALKSAGCERIFEDTISGTQQERRGLSQLLEYARRGDTLVVYSLDRLARTSRQLIETVDLLTRKGIFVRSYTQSFDTSTQDGAAMLKVFGMLSELERTLIIERTHAGIGAARARGRFGGRPRKFRDVRGVEVLKDTYNEGKLTVPEICKKFRISRATFYRYLRA